MSAPRCLTDSRTAVYHPTQPLVPISPPHPPNKLFKWVLLYLVVCSREITTAVLWIQYRLQLRLTSSWLLRGNQRTEQVHCPRRGAPQQEAPLAGGFSICFKNVFPEQPFYPRQSALHLGQLPQPPLAPSFSWSFLLINPTGLFLWEPHQNTY